jgi:hypothetical protein
MTTPTLTFRIKPTDNGDYLIEVSPTQFKEPTLVEMPYTCMPGCERKRQQGRSRPLSKLTF